MSDGLPRVLIIAKSCVSGSSGHAASLRNWFQGWPPEHIAELYSGGPEPEEPLSGRRYRLGPTDRRFGRLFGRLKGSALGVAAFSSQENPPPSPQASLRQRLRYGLSRLLVQSGVWELIFKVRLSAELRRFVQDFQPNVALCFGFDLSFMWLPLLLRRQLGLPYVVMIYDDWPSTLYAGHPLSFLMRPLVHRTFRQFVQRAAARLVFAETMQRAYQEKYQADFAVLRQCADSTVYREATPRRVGPENAYSIVYSGTLGHRRWEAILDMAEVLRRCAEEGLRAHLTVFAPPWDHLPELQQLPHVSLAPLPAPPETPGIFKGADVLFLPESFDPQEARAIRYSISTKAHLYMMSERPILLYGPPEAGVVDYGLREGWAYVVSRRDKQALYEAVRALLSDERLRSQLVARGRQVVAQHHEAAVVREAFRQALWRAARTKEA